jgi:predicted DCC family thiol-disulfide oxidoreductase YuxK
MAWIRKRDRDQRFEFVPRQTPGLTKRFPDLEQADFNTGLRVIRPDGRRLVGADAVYYIARKLRGWRWVALLYRAPLFGFLGRKTYAWIAARRARAGRACDADCQT